MVLSDFACWAPNDTNILASHRVIRESEPTADRTSQVTIGLNDGIVVLVPCAVVPDPPVLITTGTIRPSQS
ncbi:hypothetical protein GWI33_007857 [Rhynchophorus ferrugineus]|uniref:Uncharacterized protein n=1 Tax=Rhynchophorus ferrugineus TaxID=354439 RepID=A0A834MGC1_RHYFE|nr:hypothetical protein GWI33_007857 [Rhynchophorus ferrugineus]